MRTSSLSLHEASFSLALVLRLINNIYFKPEIDLNKDKNRNLLHTISPIATCSSEIWIVKSKDTFRIVVAKRYL